ncbi:MAG: FG-GAP-like repeat-containing protein [Methylococcales bacterium]
MALKLLATKFWLLFLIVLLMTVYLVIHQTPIVIPAGFPYAAKALTTDQLNLKSNQSDVKFVDKTLDSGLSFIHQQGDVHLAGLDESLGSGVCAADFNNDGWVDLYLVNGSGHTRYYGKQYWWQNSQGNALYLNESGQQFHDATVTSGLSKQMWGMGCVADDFDNDGDQDLLVTGKETRAFYKNNGNGNFTDVIEESGLTSNLWSTSAATADFNGDGLLDIYIGNFIDFKKGKKTFEANSQFAGDKKSTFDASLYEAQPNQLYLNLGGFKFKEIAAEAGVNGTDGKTLDVSWQDINNDKLPDLVVTNDRGTGSNTAFLNKDGKHFEPGGQLLGLRSALGNRGMASGDLDNDADIDLVIASAAGEATVALSKEALASAENPSSAYKDRAREMGIAADQFLNQSAWSPIIQDFNNDGFGDIFLANGQVEPDPDSAKVSEGQPKQLLLNTGNKQFVDVTGFAGKALQDAQSARGAVSADFDNDGDLDIYVSHNNDLGQYLINESPPQHWLGLKLIGNKSNRDAVGATVQLLSATGHGQMKTVVSADGFLSDSDKRIVFGLGGESQVDQLIINWPSGEKQNIKSLQADRYWLVEENNVKVKELPFAPANKIAGQKLRLKLGADQDQIRARYIKMLGQSDRNDSTRTELAIAVKDASSLVRRQVIHIANQYVSVQSLGLLVRSLEDTEITNVTAAIEGLRLYEDENSIKWLLRMFFHPEATVKIATANCFAYFFQEEEAVVHRKYLAIPYLIRLLDDSDPGVRIAAAKALANAERFRGLHALLGYLQDPDPAVRAEIVRTLGLIRQGEAVVKLRLLVSDNSQSASVLANTVIALKRLGDESALKTLAALVMGQGGGVTKPIEERLAVLAEVISQEYDAAVLDSGQLNKLARDFFDQFSGSFKFSENPAVPMRHWVILTQYLKTPRTDAWLNRKTQASQAMLRELAYSALYSQNPENSHPLLKRAWSDLEPAINQWALQCLLQTKLPLNKEDYRKILATPEYRLIAIKVWHEHGVSADSEVLTAALHSRYLSGHSDNKKLQGPKIISESDTGAIKTLAMATEVKPTLLESICFSQINELQDFCPILIFAKNIPAHRELAKRLLQNIDYPIGPRQAVLEQYNDNFDQDAVNTLYTIAQIKKDPLRSAVLNKLFSFKSDALFEFANKVANNASEQAEVRFQAIESLVRQGHAEAQEILYR